MPPPLLPFWMKYAHLVDEKAPDFGTEFEELIAEAYLMLCGCSRLSDFCLQPVDVRTDSASLDRRYCDQIYVWVE